MKAIKLRKKDLAYKMIQELNDILAFADDTLIYGENMYDIRRAIEGIKLEIDKIGLEINP